MTRVIPLTRYDFGELEASGVQAARARNRVGVRGFREGTLLVRTHAQNIAGGSDGAIRVVVRESGYTREDPAVLFDGEVVASLLAADVSSSAPRFVTIQFPVRSDELVVEVEGTQDSGSGAQALEATVSVDVQLRDVATAVYEVSGFTNSTTYYRTAAGEGVRGSVNGFWVGVLFRLSAIPAAAQFLTNCGSSTGWQFRVAATGQLQWRVEDGTSTPITVTASAFGADDLGPVHGAIGYRDGSNEIHLVLDGAEVGSGTSITGYTAPAAGNFHTMGVNNAGSGSALANGSILGIAGGDSVVPTADEIAAWFRACKSLHDIARIPGKTDHLWSVAANGATAPAEMRDRVASDGMDRTGVMVANAFRPEWAW